MIPCRWGAADPAAICIVLLRIESRRDRRRQGGNPPFFRGRREEQWIFGYSCWESKSMTWIFTGHLGTWKMMWQIPPSSGLLPNTSSPKKKTAFPRYEQRRCDSQNWIKSTRDKHQFDPMFIYGGFLKWGLPPIWMVYMGKSH